MNHQPDVTQLLLAWGSGDENARERLIPLVYEELHRLAERQMAGERPDHTLQASALIHETYLKLIDVTRIQWQNRAHFMTVAGRLMRRILVDFARSRRRLKRGGGASPLVINEALMGEPSRTGDVVAIDDALEALEAIDPRKVRVVELRFFAGLNIEETAEALEVSPETVQRDWRFAKLWLYQELAGQQDSEVEHGNGPRVS